MFVHVFECLGWWIQFVLPVLPSWDAFSLSHSAFEEMDKIQHDRPHSATVWPPLTTSPKQKSTQTWNAWDNLGASVCVCVFMCLSVGKPLTNHWREFKETYRKNSLNLFVQLTNIWSQSKSRRLPQLTNTSQHKNVCQLCRYCTKILCGGSWESFTSHTPCHNL